MNTETRPLEQQRRELRRRWVNLRDSRQLHKKAWRVYMEAGMETAARSCENMISAARDEMQHVAAQRLSTTARATRAEANSSCPAPGSASLTWSVVPTRAGWWLAFGGTLRYPVIYYVTDNVARRPGCLCIYEPHNFEWIDVRDLGPRWWSGPIELPEPWGGPTTPNAKLMDGAQEGVRAAERCEAPFHAAPGYAPQTTADARTENPAGGGGVGGNL